MWEYKVHYVQAKTLSEETLNDFGLKGWELVTVNYIVYNISTAVYYFKRPISKDI